MKVLDVGCGKNKEKDSIGIDKYSLPGVDIVCDLNHFPGPIEENYFDKVIFRHSINHLNNLLDVMNEVHRISKRDAEIIIIAPHFSSDNIFTDPTIKFFMGIRTMDFFTNAEGELSKRFGYYSQSKFSIQSKKILFFKKDLHSRRDKLLNILFKPLDFIFNRIPRFYEKYLAFIIRANEINFVLKVHK